MKKAHLPIFAAMLAAVLLLAGCAPKPVPVAPDNPYIGRWTAVKCFIFDEETPVTDVFSTGLELELSEDGTAKLISDETEDAVWVPYESGVALRGNLRMLFTEEDGLLVTSIVGAKICFEKVQEG